MSHKFKVYNQQQNWLFPPSIEELIPQEHPVRIVNGVIEHLDIKPLLEAYNKDDQPSYYPKIMLKVMVYAYMDNTYSSRKIVKAMRENINFMWLPIDKWLTITPLHVLEALNLRVCSRISLNR